MSIKNQLVEYFATNGVSCFVSFIMVVYLYLCIFVSFPIICVVYGNPASGCQPVLNSCFVALVKICVGVLKIQLR